MNEAGAAQAYADFHGGAPRKVAVYDLPENDINAWRLGRMTAIAYQTVRDGAREDYIHEFGRGKGPFVDIGPASQVYLTEGRFSVTDRGFEDHDEMPALLTVNPKGRGEPAKKKAFPMKRNSKGQYVAKAKRTPAPKRRKSNPVPALKTRTVVRYRDKAPRRVSRRRNPSPRRSKINLGNVVMNGAMQGAGGVITSVVAGLLPLPANLKTGVPLAITKSVIAIGLGMGVAQYINPRLGENIATGGATVAIYDAMRSFMPSNIPMGQIQQDLPMGALYSNDMGAWLVNDPESGQTLVLNEMGDWQTIDVSPNFGYATAANTVDDVARYNY
jgi:hypothetical protein